MYYEVDSSHITNFPAVEKKKIISRIEVKIILSLIRSKKKREIEREREREKNQYSDWWMLICPRKEDNGRIASIGN